MKKYFKYLIVLTVLATVGIVIYFTCFNPNSENGLDTADVSAETKEGKVADEIVYDPELYISNGLPQLFINTPDNQQIGSKIELYLNYQYQGTYQIGEKTNLSKGRVLDGDDGYLVEIDFRAKENQETYFIINRLKNPLVIKRLKINGIDEVSNDDANYNYVADFFSTADSGTH